MFTGFFLLLVFFVCLFVFWLVVFFNSRSGREELKVSGFTPGFFSTLKIPDSPLQYYQG